MSVEQSRHLQIPEQKNGRANERGAAIAAYALGISAVLGLGGGLLAAWQVRPTILSQEDSVEVQSGEATLRAVKTDAPETCYWQFDTEVRGTKVKVERKNKVNVPDDVPFLPDDVNVTPGLWVSSEFNGMVVNKVCSPVGTLVPTLSAEGKFDLDLVPKMQETGESPEGVYSFISYIDQGQPPLVNENGVAMPLHANESGGLWGATKVEEWLINKVKDAGADKVLGAKKYKGDLVDQYAMYVVETQATEDSAKCWTAASEAAEEGMKQNMIELFLSQNPDLSVNDIGEVVVPKVNVNDIHNQYGKLGEFRVIEGAEVSVDAAEIDTDECEIGTEINETPQEALAEAQ